MLTDGPRARLRPAEDSGTVRRSRHIEDRGALCPRLAAMATPCSTRPDSRNIAASNDRRDPITGHSCQIGPYDFAETSLYPHVRLDPLYLDWAQAEG